MSAGGARWTAAAAVCVLLSALHTWPLATAPATLSLNYNGDVMLNEWIVAWIQHQLPRAPLALFQANIFHPAPDALAFSEPLIVPALIGAPARLLGGSPVLVHNLLLLGGLALTMLGGYALAHHWTADHAASLVAGAAYAFNTQSLMRLEHLQAAHAYALPLAVLSADRLIETGGRRQAVWLAAWMTAAVYTSGYLAIFAALTIAVLLAARISGWRRRPAAVVTGFAVAACLAGLAALPLSLPYRRAAREQGMIRTLDGVADYSASLDGYRASYGLLHGRLWRAAPRRAAPEAFFPGVVVTGLALISLAAAVRRSGPARRYAPFLVALAVTGCVLSLGTRTPAYGWLYAAFPPLAGLRAASRFGGLFLLAAALLAAFGLAAVRTRLPRRAALVAGAATLALVTAEAARPPIPYTEFDGIPGIYRWLAHVPGPVVLVEVPFYPPEAIFQNAEYVLNSTAHWRPLMNGYSGYTPASYRAVAWPFWNFPAAWSIAAMRQAGVTHLIVHPDRFEPEGAAVLAAALASPDLERLAVSRRNVTLFRLRPQASGPASPR